MLARPILTLPCISLEDYWFSAKWPAQTGRPRLRPGPLFVQPSQLAASFVFSNYNVALIGPYRKWRDIRHESVMRSITDSQLERAVIGFSAPAAILRAL